MRSAPGSSTALLFALLSAGSAFTQTTSPASSARVADVYTTLYFSAAIDTLAWDKSNHLYALDYRAGKLYIFTVTGTSVSGSPDPPYSIPRAYGVHGLIVVPKI